MVAPFPWFGGKARVAGEVWEALGNVEHYVEPFAGSLAVLLQRPHVPRIETVNDLDGYVANFWRAVRADPEGVAEYADWPVNETDLEARHLWLVNTGRQRLEALRSDPDYHDAQVAGWWVWGQCAWIGSGWCSGEGPWMLAGTAGRGINRQLPNMHQGEGVNRWSLAGDGALAAYILALSRRLRRVRVCCGDWARVVTDGALNAGATVGVFLDPPYSDEVRTRGLYAQDNAGVDISRAVREWALAHEGDSRLRIVLAGYEGEHAMPERWRVHAYRAKRAYGTAAGAGLMEGNNANRRRERLWFSPSCERAQDVLPL
jgi:DNA adenine methylase